MNVESEKRWERMRINFALSLHERPNRELLVINGVEALQFWAPQGLVPPYLMKRQLTPSSVSFLQEEYGCLIQGNFIYLGVVVTTLAMLGCVP